MRTFIAIELAEEEKDYLAALQAETQRHCRRGNYTPRENFHLTLHFLGEVEEADLEYLRDALYETGRRNRPFSLTIGQIGFFPRGRQGVLWAGTEKSGALQRLSATLEKSLEQQGFAPDKKGFSPHITLGREVEPQVGFLQVQKSVSVTPRRFAVQHIALMQSVRRGAKLVYVPLFRQGLSGR